MGATEQHLAAAPNVTTAGVLAKSFLLGRHLGCGFTHARSTTPLPPSLNKTYCLMLGMMTSINSLACTFKLYVLPSLGLIWDSRGAT